MFWKFLWFYNANSFLQTIHGDKLPVMFALDGLHTCWGPFAYNKQLAGHMEQGGKEGSIGVQSRTET